MRRRLKLQVLLATLAVGLSSALAADSTTPPPEPEGALGTLSDVDLGAQKAASCAGCHNGDGNSTMPSWPKLAGLPATYTTKQLHDYKTGARPDAMMAGAVAAMTDEDMRLVGLYYATQKVKFTPASDQLAEQGKAIYLDGIPQRRVPSCAACHGAAGKGFSDLLPGGVPSLKSQHYEFVKKEMLRYRSGERKNDVNGVMQYAAVRMTDEEIDAVSQYINTLK